jgi:Zn-finger nucleic acid-binding protein
MKLSPDRHYYLCEYCRTIYLPEETGDGIRCLNEASEVACPVCNIHLMHAWIGETAALNCPRCRGILLEQNAFLITLRYLRARSKSPSIQPGPVRLEELKRHIRCPYCRMEMDAHPYGGPGNIVVDNCPHCTVIWLDPGEVSRVIRAPGRDRGEWT